MVEETRKLEKGMMTAVFKQKPEPGAVVSEARVPAPGPNDVLVKIKACSICGTDVHIFEWDEWSQSRVKPPLIFGHEGAGEVIEVGKNVLGVELGDFVSFETHVACGYCFQCRTGNAHVCEDTKILGVDIGGVFAEYAVVPAPNAWRNPPGLDPAIASIQEPFGNAVHAVFGMDDDSVVGKTVLITGCGPIGLCAIAICKASGVSAVYAVEKNDYRIGLAKKMGAEKVFKPEEALEGVLAETSGRGVDVFLEMSGASQAFNLGFKAMRVGGRATIFGIYKKPFEVDVTNDIVFKYARIYGINGRRMFDTWFKTREFLSRGLVDIRPLITHKFPLKDFLKGMEVMRSGNSGKVVLYP